MREDEKCNPGRGRLVFPLLAVACASFSAYGFDFFEPVTPPRAFQVMVHRGMMHQAPENTRPALERVIEDGMEWAEVDVRLTKDGHHVILHDSSVDGKTDGSGKVQDLTLGEIRALDAGTWFAPHFAEERILTLPECLALAKGRLNLYLDCKDVDPELLAKEILAADMARQVAVFNDLDVLAVVREKSGGRIPLMPKWHPEFGLEAWTEKWRPDAVEINADQVTAEICRFFHQQGIKVQAKVLGDDDHPEVWDRMLAAGVDWLQTDRPEDILAHRLWKSQAKRPVLMAAHRGAKRYAPENTMAAFEKAVALGADYVEIDIRTTQDGRYFILHDGNLDRTTNGQGPVEATDAAAIASLDAGGWFGKYHQNTAIPSLDETLDYLKGKAQVYVDAKDIPVEVLAEALRSKDLVDKAVVYQSPSYLVKLKALLPDARALCPLGNPKQVERLAEKVRPYAFDASWEILSKELIARCHALGIQVFSDGIGDADTVEDYRQAIEWGIDLIQTDHPLRVVRAVEIGGRSEQYRRLSVEEYRDKMAGGWIGQIVGVAWGAPTEFKFTDRIIPEDKVPEWTPKMINHAFAQDDLYVEMTFLRSMEQYGLDVSIRQAGIDFANSEYQLWCANHAGRTNLRMGIAPPDSSHPQFNSRANDIDYQIEADYSGLIAPGMPETAIRLGEKFGRLMNYSDGMYAGQFMGGMYAEAFFEHDPVRLVKAGLKCIPRDCQYAEMVRDMLQWYDEDPDDWQRTWKLIQKKYRENPEYQKASNGAIDCKINGAYVLLGLLYGKGVPEQTILISCRAGCDSDCNPSSAAGVLFTAMGFSKLPARFSTGLDETAVFSHTAYDFPALLDVCEELARQSLSAAGGRIEKNDDGQEEFVIPIVKPQPSPLVLTWDPGPIAGSMFTPAEMAQITQGVYPSFQRFAPGWELVDCGPDMDAGLKKRYRGKRQVFMTHPLDRETPCRITRTVDVPKGKRTALDLVVSHHDQGDAKGNWALVVKVDGKQLKEQKVSSDTVDDGWLELSVDLTSYAGQTVELELLNVADGWRYEAGYWASIELRSGRN